MRHSGSALRIRCRLCRPGISGRREFTSRSVAPKSFLTIAFGGTALLLGCSLRAASVPFEGCPSFGQIKRLGVPKGTAQAVPIGEKDAQKVALYRSEDGIGVLAPRDWYCQGVSGSGGAILYVGPRPIVRRSSGWEGLNGPVIEAQDIPGEYSGRYYVAELMQRVFLAYRSFAPQLLYGYDVAPPSGAFPQDKLTYRGDRVVEYTTPAGAAGLGNFDSNIGRTDFPISGVAILSMDAAHEHSNIPPHVLLLSIRLPREITDLTRAIIQYAERSDLGEK